MKQRITLYTFLLSGLIMLFTNTDTKASHIMGGDITYNCIAPNTYAFTAQFYRDCNGVPLPPSVSLTIYSPSGCGPSQTITLELVPSGQQVVTPLCPGVPDVCNGSGTYGIQQYTYTHVPASQGSGTSSPPVVLNSSCTDWTVWWSSCCRNGTISTGPANDGFYLETLLNNQDAPCNNSPTFLNIPTPYACVGETVNYSHGVSEWDGDSLVFSLIPCLQGNAPSPSSVNYASPYSGTSPLSSSTGFSINAQTGAITFTPNVAQVGVICVMVEEYRNGVKIGHVMRDMQFTVLNCSNTLPLASGVDGTASSAGTTGSYNVQVCEGETIDFMISTFDTLATGQVTGDNINLSWNGGINSPNASFTVFNNGTDSSSARFKWTTTKNDAGFYIFTVNLQDDACPINGVNIFTFTVTVDDVPDVDAGGYQVACNPNDSLVLNAVQNNLDLSYQWITETGSGTVSDPTILGPQVPPVTGTYKLIKTYQSGCIDSNLVAVDLSPGLQIPTIPDANLCQGDSIQMNATIPVTSNPPSFFSNNTVTPFGQAADTAISVITVTGVQPGVFQADMLQSVCIDVTYPLTSFLSVSLVSPSGTVINLSSNNGNGSNFTNTCFEANAATSITAGNNPFTGTYSPEGTFSSFNGDVVNGDWTLWVATSTAIPLPNLQLNSWSMTFVDITDTISYQWTPATDLSCTTCPDPWASPTTPTNYQIIATDFFGCTDTQNVFIDIISALTAPVVTCAQVTTTSLTFAWGAVTGATGYEVSIDNGATWVPANGTLQHQITGLALGQSVTILVRGISTCPGTPPAGTQTCTTTPCTLDASFVNSTDVSCNAGSDGTLDVSAIGGTPSYTYQIGTQPIQTSPNFTGLSAGNYTATVTDVNGCIDTVQVTINEPSAITFTTDSLLTSCFGSADGVAIVAATGGTGAFSYQWDTNAGSQTTDTATALAAGVYNVTMTDANSCFTVGTVTVSEPPLILLDSMTIDVSCNAAMDGSAQVLVQGGTGPFTYAWSSNANGQTLDSIVGLNGGTYTVSVTDINGCLDSLSMYVDEASAIALSTAMTPATCNGFNDGAITVTAAGGTPGAIGYSYQWSANANNQTTNTASNLGTGIYFVTVTDSDGCTEIISDTVIAPLGMLLTVASDNASTTCSYNNDGTAVVTPTGGNGGYSYSWSQGTNPADSAVTGLSAGVSYITVTDVLGCTEVDSITITAPTPIVINPTPVAISCNGADDGSITLAPVGGTGAYTFTWSNNDTTQDISGLTAGTYFVTVSDDNDCSFIDSAIIIEPDTLQTLASMTVVSCFGGNDGTASALPSGVQLPFSYAWSNGSSDSTATGLTAGTYTLTVTDAAGCTDSATVIVTEPSTAVSSTTSGTDLLCNGDGSGTVTVIGTGGTPDPSITSGYTHQWSDANNQTTATATGLQAGTYYVTVTDLNGCSTVDSVTINEPTALTGVTNGTPASCFGSLDGTVSVTPSGGTSPYTYQWSAPSNSTDSLVIGLGAGWHYVTVTDANACTYVDSFEVLRPTLITTVMTVDSTSCFGDSTGTGFVTATGGTGAYSYAWSYGSVTTSNISGLPAGWYYVTVTDANACTAVDSMEVLEPSLLTSSTTVQDADCFGASTGSATVTGAGGTLNYSYQWDALAGNATTATASNLAAGTYSVTVTDMNGCTSVSTAVVGEPSTAVSSTTSGTDLLCNGDGSGTVTVIGTGGTPDPSIVSGYTYQWSDANAQTTATATGLQAGTYYVTVTDLNGCSTVDSVTINEPTALTGVTNGTPASCFGSLDGTVSVTPSGGTSPYTYQWSAPSNSTDSLVIGLGAGWHYVTVTDANACTYVDSFEVLQPTLITTVMTVDSTSCFGDSTGTGFVTATGGTGAYSYAWSYGSVTTSNISGLPAGWYYLTVTDANACTAVDSMEVLEPSLLTSSTTAQDADCFGASTGSATVTGAGGTLNYSYQWDALAGNATTATALNLAAGTYSVTVTDMNGCTSVSTAVVGEPSTAVSSTTSGTDLLCNGDGSGTVTVIGTGGTPDPSIASGYTYQWSDANNQTTATAIGLQAGTYYVTVTDLNGCSTVDSVTINEPTALTGVTNGTPASCFGSLDGTVSVTPSGGTSPYTYQWSAPSNSTDSLVIGLGAGWHHVTVTDANACTYVDSFEVLQPAMIMTATSVTPVGCFGDSTGTAGVTVTGGNGGETFIWSFGNITTQNITGLPAGWHYVTVTDINGCSTVDSVEVIEPTPIALSTTQVDVGCFGDATGSATVISTGGTPGYTYLWNSTPQQTSATATNLPAGTYTATVTDLNGCSDTISVTITQPATAVSITDISFTQVSCNGGSDGTATVTATGGAGNYTYNWSSGQTTQTTTGLPIGTYTVTVTDANGCSTTGSVTIDEPAPITTIFTNVSGSSCNSGSDGTATIAASGGVPNGANGYTYVWNTVPAQNGTTATGLNGGQTYSVVVTDANGCTTIDSVYIPQPDPVTLSTTQVNVSCYSFDDAEATVIPVGGTPGYTFLWDVNAGNQTTGTATGLTAGSYSVVVTDANGCTATTGVTITQPAELVTNKTTVDVLCKGESTGEAEVLMSGGTGPYFINWEGGLSNPPTDLAAGTYSYVVTDANGCQLTDSVTIEEPQNGVSALFESVDVTCYDDRDGIINIYPNGGVGPYQFSLDGVSFDDNHSKIGLQGGDYTYYVRDDNGCIYSETVTIGEPDEFTVDLGPDVDIIMGESVQLEVIPSNGTPNYTYTWTPAENLSCTDCGNPTVDSLQDDRYITVLVEDLNGCTAEDDIYIRMEKPRYVFIANAFTPNDDGNNDWLFVQGGIGTKRVVSFQVFDRWGEIVYEITDAPLNDSASGWDGTYKGQEMNGGVFVWVAEVEFEDGERLVYKGNTVLIR